MLIISILLARKNETEILVKLQKDNCSWLAEVILNSFETNAVQVNTLIG